MKRRLYTLSENGIALNKSRCDKLITVEHKQLKCIYTVVGTIKLQKSWY